MVEIHAKKIQVSYEKKVVIDQLDCRIPNEAITTIIGSNGCGKSTLLKSLTRILPVKAGQVLIDGKEIHSMNSRQVAQKLAFLPQVNQAPSGLSVYDLVSYGRFPHQYGLGRLRQEDKGKIDWALRSTGLHSLAQAQLDSLSGGQRQRAWIAMALAQDTDIIFLDEPTTYLDLNHQLEILELLKSLQEESHKTIIMVLHDINLAARFSQHMIAMKEGQIRYQGCVEELMTAPVLRDIFGIEAQIIQDPVLNVPLCLSYNLLPSPKLKRSFI